MTSQWRNMLVTKGGGGPLETLKVMPNFGLRLPLFCCIFYFVPFSAVFRAIMWHWIVIVGHHSDTPLGCGSMTLWNHRIPPAFQINWYWKSFNPEDWGHPFPERNYFKVQNRWGGEYISFFKLLLEGKKNRVYIFIIFFFFNIIMDSLHARGKKKK